MPAARCASPLSWAPRAAAALLVALSWLATVGAAQAEPTFPVLTSRITDEAGLLSADDYTAIQAELAALEQKSTDQVAVVTLKSLDGYADRGLRLSARPQVGHRAEGQGQRHPADRGAERAQGAHRGRPRARAHDDRRHVEPHHPERHPAEFRRGNFSAGIRAGVRDIKDVLLGDAEEVKERARQARGDDLDFWSIVTHRVLALRRVVHALRHRAIHQQRAASSGRPAAPRRTGRSARKLRRLGRRLVGRRGRRRRMVGRRRRFRRRRFVGELVMQQHGLTAWETFGMRPFSAADEQRISEAIADAERQTSGEIVVVVAVQSDGYYYVPPLVAAIVALLVPWVLIHFTLLDMRSIYLIQLAVFFVLTALLMPAPIRTALVPAGIQAPARPAPRRRAIPRPEPAHDLRAHRRPAVRLGRRASRRNHRRQGDRRKGARPERGSTSSTISPPPSAAGTRPTALSRPSPPSAPSSRSTFRPAPTTRNELPDHLIILW